MSLAAGRISSSPRVKGFLALVMWLATKNDALSANTFDEVVAFTKCFCSLCSHFFYFEKLQRLVFFFPPFIFIRWRLITLQYCNGFCDTLTSISHGFACVPHPDPPSLLLLHPISLDLPRAPISCIQPGLVICFTLDNIIHLKKPQINY